MGSSHRRDATAFLCLLADNRMDSDVKFQAALSGLIFFKPVPQRTNGVTFIPLRHDLLRNLK